MNVRIMPTANVTGPVAAPPSKAQTHRAFFAALLPRGSTRVVNPLRCDDTDATKRSVKALGAKISGSTTQVVSSHGTLKPPRGIINCGESGVTMRFVIPLLTLIGTDVELKAEASLMRRPIEPLAEALEQLHSSLVVKDRTIRVCGDSPEGGTVKLRGDISSQFISGLLLSGTLMKKGINLEVTSPLESRNYVLLTIEILRRHGVHVNVSQGFSGFKVLGGQKPLPTMHKISGDYSSAAFHLSAAAITRSPLTVNNLAQTLEPDSVIVDFLSRMGVKTTVDRNSVTVHGGKLMAADVDIRECPDLGPIIAVLGCYADGKTTIKGARRLRYKESDRLASMRTELDSLGADVLETDDGLTVEGPVMLKGGTVHTHNDHRIAMALSVAALGAEREIVIEGAECVNKSYPDFFGDLRSIGVEVVG
jgi:3-phosphoshikimate 1-carboxyvinyltransferase